MEDVQGKRCEVGGRLDINTYAHNYGVFWCEKCKASTTFATAEDPVQQDPQSVNFCRSCGTIVKVSHL